MAYIRTEVLVSTIRSCRMADCPRCDHRIPGTACRQPAIRAIIGIGSADTAKIKVVCTRWLRHGAPPVRLRSTEWGIL